MAKRTYNIPNMLTYGRIVAVPLVVLCFFLEGHLKSTDFARWAALALFAVASITDYLDGYLARLWKQSSTIGRMLDPIADKLLVSGLPAASGCGRDDCRMDAVGGDHHSLPRDSGFGTARISG